MMRLVKRAPTKKWESNYDVSDALLQRIADDCDIGPLTAVLMLAKGETLRLSNPFGTPVEWTLEEVAEAIA